MDTAIDDIPSGRTEKYDAYPHHEGPILTTHLKQRLSSLDKKILKILLKPNGRTSSHIAAAGSSNGIIADKLGISLGVVKRRRALLEKRHLESWYNMNVTGVGHKRIDFLIATERGLTIPIAKKLLKFKEVATVSRSIGQPTIDLRAELIVKDHGQLLELLEQAKGIDGVRDVVWSEVVQVVGKKGSVPPKIIDVL
jgi:DNA-binding Lrp family transcriptional regulator